MAKLANETWLKENPDRVLLQSIVCVKYGHPDLAAIHRYLEDFGLVKGHEGTDNEGRHCVYYAGYGTQPVVYIAAQTPAPIFLGVYFEAQSKADFEKTTKVPGAGSRIPFLDGEAIPFTDMNGVPVHVVYGHSKKTFEAPTNHMLLPANYPAASDKDTIAKPRRNNYQRMTRGPAPVHKLGHVAIWCTKMEEAMNFYGWHFNFAPSDVIFTPDGSVQLFFMHIDLGEDYSDHHTFLLAAPFGPEAPGLVQHAAFEVQSIDVNFMGHDHLKKQGYKSFWGVGRHIQGSQVFDYWLDIDGFMVEHYADSDVVNKHHKVGLAYPPYENNNWGPEPDMGPALGIKDKEDAGQKKMAF